MAAIAAVPDITALRLRAGIGPQSQRNGGLPRGAMPGLAVTAIAGMRCLAWRRRQTSQRWLIG